MTYIGISRGATGTIGIIDENDNATLVPVPWTWKNQKGHKHLNYQKFIEILKPYIPVDENDVRQKLPAKVVMEKPIGFNWDTKRSVNIQKFIASNRFYEAEMAILECLGIPVTLVEPYNWHKDLFTQKYKKLSDVQASIEYGNDLYPELKQSKCKDRDGICMAFWLKNQKLFGK